VRDDIAEFAVRDAAREWAKSTLSLQRDLYVDVQANVHDYFVCAPDGYAIHNVREVNLDCCPLRPHLNPDCYEHPGSFYFENPDRVLIGAPPCEDVKEGLMVRATVHPGESSCAIDRWVLDRHAEDIATGALSRLLLQPDAPWFSTALGGVMMRRWKTSLNRAKGAQAKNHVSGPTFMKVPRWV
jgi:hypothetical protein